MTGESQLAEGTGTGMVAGLSQSCGTRPEWMGVVLGWRTVEQVVSS